MVKSYEDREWPTPSLKQGNLNYFTRGSYKNKKFLVGQKLIKTLSNISYIYQTINRTNIHVCIKKR